MGTLFLAAILQWTFKAAFGCEPDNLSAVAVKTDSDSTGTAGRADYDDIRLEN